MAGRRRSRREALEAAGQLAFDLRPAATWDERLARAVPLRLPLAPGVSLESEYRHWGAITGPGAWALLPRLRRGGGSRRELIASRWLPWLYVAVWLRRVG